MAQEAAVQFRPGAEMKAWIAEQGKIRGKKQSVGLAANDSLNLLRALLAAELSRQTWSLEDLAILDRATRTVRPDTAAAAGFPGQTWGAVRDHADRTDPQVSALLDQLDHLGPTADKALLHAVTTHRDRDLADDAQGWAEVGVTVA